jgi:hypothetical protein
MGFHKLILLWILCVLIFMILYSLADSFSYTKEGFLLGTTGVEEICRSDNRSCFDISYIDQITSENKRISAKISPGYFIDTLGYLAPIPYGYIGSTNMRSYVPIPNIGIDNSKNYTQPPEAEAEAETKTSNKNYNSNNLDITYHADPMDGQQTDESTAGIGKMWIEISGNLYSVPYSDVSNTTLYNQPGTYKFNSASYVPNYEESVYLSNRTAEKPTPTQSIEDMYYDVCLSTEHSIMEREAKCNALDKTKCMASGCCVLLGGEKCIAGNQSGATNRSNYSDHTIINRDYYYYRNKCYGNCVGP